jgi:hypothetical protein
MIKGVSGLADLADGYFAYGGNVMGAKTVYFVDGNNGADQGAGDTWDTAFKTLTYALAVSNTDIASGAKGWAARNVIFCKADYFEEDLVLLAQKTDVVGVGSYDWRTQPGLVGNHVPTGTTASYGTRFFNFDFRGDTSGGVIWTLDSYCSNVGFYGCRFDAQSATDATTGILATASPYMNVVGCNFSGPFSTAAISIGAGTANQLRIVDNDIQSGAVGILINASATCGDWIGKIIGNRIYATTLTIDDNSDKFVVENNNLISLATTEASAVDINKAIAANNFLRSTDLASVYPELDFTE